VSDAPPDFFARNMRYAKEGPYHTFLMPSAESMFRMWLQANAVPFDPQAKTPDYDMRGFWSGLMSGSPIAKTAINPNDQQIHFPDYWKTPYHQTFSRESQWAMPWAPSWNNLDQLVMPGSGRVQYDERARFR